MFGKREESRFLSKIGNNIKYVTHDPNLIFPSVSGLVCASCLLLPASRSSFPSWRRGVVAQLAPFARVKALAVWMVIGPESNVLITFDGLGGAYFQCQASRALLDQLCPHGIPETGEMIALALHTSQTYYLQNYYETCFNNLNNTRPTPRLWTTRMRP